MAGKAELQNPGGVYRFYLLLVATVDAGFRDSGERRDGGELASAASDYILRIGGGQCLTVSTRLVKDVSCG